MRRRSRRADGSITARDFLWLLLLVMLLLINPPTKADDAVTPPGNMIVTIAWPEGATDVDLWVRGPGESKAVGFSNRGGTLFNLLRDDLGTSNDTMPANYENAYSRGLPAGRYVINAHCYTCGSTVRVSIEVRMNVSGGEPMLVFSSFIDLAPRQEKTAIQFRLDDQHRIHDKTNVFEPLRVAK